MDTLTIIAPQGHQPAMPGKSHGNRVRALFEPLPAHQRILRQIIELKLGDWLGATLLDLRNPKPVRECALARYRRLPARDTLHAWDDELCHALDGKTDEKTLSILLAIMFDGFPQAKTQSVKTYIDAALLVIGDNGLSPETIAATIARVWRKNRFPPSISEFLDECEEAKKSATGTRRVVSRRCARRDGRSQRGAGVFLTVKARLRPSRQAPWVNCGANRPLSRSFFATVWRPHRCPY